MDDQISVPEAVRRYGLSRRSIQRLYESGLLSLEKRVGQRATLVSAAALEEALKQRRPRGRPRKADSPVTQQPATTPRIMPTGGRSRRRQGS